MSFFTRLRLAFLFLFGGALPREAFPAAEPTLALPPPEPQPATPPSAEERHASALFLLGLLQREGRFLDFLQEDIAGFSDSDVGAAARLVHEGCKKVLSQYVPTTPVVKETEGAQVDVAKGFDANRFRLTGNVTGEGPWKGSLKHHGWVTTRVGLPDVPTTVDVKVLAPAEVELS